MSPRVVAGLADKLADLHCWGRGPDGAWWGLISWSVYGPRDGGGNGTLYLSAWAAAGTLTPSSDPAVQRQYQAVERLDLPADAVWPTPAGTAGRDWHHYGPITAPPGPPPGIAELAGIPAPSTAAEAD